MFWDSDTKYPSRKYVDLLWTSCAKYSVWNPSYDNIQVGDYGVINRETGQFDRNGNIYEEGFVPSHPGKHAPREYSGSTGVISVTSLNARAVRVVPSINMDAQVAKLKFQGRWVFSRGIGAVLAAYDPEEMALPRDLNISAVTGDERLKDMCLVTSVTTCPAYALYLAARDDTEVSLKLVGQSPVGTIPITAGGGLELGWHSEHGGGYYRAQAGGNEPFTVLYELKVCQPKPRSWWHRDSPEPELHGVDALEDAKPPWPSLDDNGKEEELYEG